MSRCRSTRARSAAASTAGRGALSASPGATEAWLVHGDRLRALEIGEGIWSFDDLERNGGNWM